VTPLKGTVFVHFAYIDDSGMKDKENPIRGMAGVIIHESKFHFMELRTGAIAERAIPKDRWIQFEEFHAWQLYGGYGPFDGVPKELRMRTIEFMLEGLAQTNAAIVYSIQAKDDPNAIDTCFRSCMESIERFIAEIQPPDVVMLIVDDCNPPIKNILKQSFRELRQHIRKPVPSPGQLWHFHDALGFFDSKDSVGVQIADLCAYFITKHEKNMNPEPDIKRFYEIIKDRLIQKGQ
jgi:hypothetical protein